jgi:hypothetical protein
LNISRNNRERFVRAAFRVRVCADENRVGDGVAHFVEIFFRHIRNRVGVFLSQFAVFVENTVSQSVPCFSIKESKRGSLQTKRSFPDRKTARRVRRIAEQAGLLPPAFHGKHLIVPRFPIGFAKKSSAKVGISGTRRQIRLEKIEQRFFID